MGTLAFWIAGLTCLVVIGYVDARLVTLKFQIQIYSEIRIRVNPKKFLISFDTNRQKIYTI